MKLAKIPAVLALVYIIFSCDVMLPPERGRENPLDPDNPVAPVGDFNCVAVDTNSVKLTWTVPGDKVPAGIVIIRKEGTEPVSMTDGVELDDAAVILNNGEYTDTGLETNKDYWYAAWTYDEAEEHFTGPVTDKASTKMGLVYLNPVLDGHIYGYASLTYRYFTDKGLRISTGIRSGTSYKYHSFMTFNSALIPGNVAEALLSLWVYTWVPANETLTVSRIAESWSDADVAYNDTTNVSFIDSTSSVSAVLQYESNSIDLTEIVQQWASGDTNEGIMLEGNKTIGGQYTDMSSSETDLGTEKVPVLSIYYSDE